MSASIPARNWFAEPWAFVLWTYLQLQEIDRRRQWVERMQRIELGYLMNWAFAGSRELDAARSAAIRAAAGPIGAKEIAAIIRGDEVAEDMKRARVVHTVLPS